jgi:hypothetical protein
MIRDRKYFIFMLCLLFLNYIHIKYFQNQQHVTLNIAPRINSNLAQTWIDEFRQIGAKHGIDKVTANGYQAFYGSILGSKRNEPMHMLEIGLECNKGYGPGKSILVWKEYFPQLKLDILEYDRKCALPFSSQVNRLYIGDQTNVTLLKEIKSNAVYDLIIDAVGHSRKQQITSFLELWPSIRTNGGLYVIEDIYTSLMSDKIYFDHEVSTMEMVYQIINNMNMPSDFNKDSTIDQKIKEFQKSILSVSCYHNACIFVRN